MKSALQSISDIERFDISYLKGWGRKVEERLIRPFDNNYFGRETFETPDSRPSHDYYVRRRTYGTNDLDYPASYWIHNLEGTLGLLVRIHDKIQPYPDIPLNFLKLISKEVNMADSCARNAQDRANGKYREDLVELTQLIEPNRPQKDLDFIRRAGVLYPSIRELEASIKGERTYVP